MREELTIDIEKIRKQPNWSVQDAETIRQISLYMIYNPNERELGDKIDPRFSISGLYPHTIKSYDIKQNE